MELTIDQRTQIRLLSDYVLYPEAEQFIAKHGTIEGQKQMNGLLNYARSIEDLTRFVKHQGSRDWLGSKAYYRDFYNALRTYLDSLRRRVKAEFGLVPEELTRTQKRELTNAFAEALAREFVQHLAAENLRKEALSDEQ